MHQKSRIGLIGCGNISTIYIKNIARFENLELAAVADLDPARAQAQADLFNIPRVLSPQQLIEENGIDIVLNLTNPAAHAEIAIAALSNGKSIYNEKPLAVLRESGAEMLALAERKGLRVGCAPDTFLAAPFQLCRKLIDEGAIGSPVAAVAFMLARGPEHWHPNPYFFYQPGSGPMHDMGPYYLTALTAILGPVVRVTGSARITKAQRVILSEPHRGKMIDVQIPSHVAGILDLASGAVVTIMTSFDTPGKNNVPNIEIYGTGGTLRVPDPNCFDGTVLLNKAGEKEWTEMTSEFGYRENSRGLGLAEMAAAIQSGRPHRASGERAYHVLEIMHAIHESSLGGRHIEITSSAARPEPLPENLAFGQVPD